MDEKIVALVNGINEDFIPLPENLWSSEFFPEHSWHFVVSTDDNTVFFCSREKLLGKGIYSAQKNVSFREYFLKRLSLTNDSIITENDLTKYGRTDVTFYKIDDENYCMDFSVH